MKQPDGFKSFLAPLKIVETFRPQAVKFLQNIQYDGSIDPDIAISLVVYAVVIVSSMLFGMLSVFWTFLFVALTGSINLFSTLSMILGCLKLFGWITSRGTEVSKEFYVGLPMILSILFFYISGIFVEADPKIILSAVCLLSVYVIYKCIPTIAQHSENAQVIKYFLFGLMGIAVVSLVLLLRYGGFATFDLLAWYRCSGLHRRNGDHEKCLNGIHYSRIEDFKKAGYEFLENSVLESLDITTDSSTLQNRFRNIQVDPGTSVIYPIQDYTLPEVTTYRALYICVIFFSLIGFFTDMFITLVRQVENNKECNKAPAAHAVVSITTPDRDKLDFKTVFSTTRVGSTWFYYLVFCLATELMIGMLKMQGIHLLVAIVLCYFIQEWFSMMVGKSGWVSSFMCKIATNMRGMYSTEFTANSMEAGAGAVDNIVIAWKALGILSVGVQVFYLFGLTCCFTIMLLMAIALVVWKDKTTCLILILVLNSLVYCNWIVLLSVLYMGHRGGWTGDAKTEKFFTYSFPAAPASSVSSEV